MVVNLAIYPVLFAKLPPEEMGIWLLINQVNSFVGLFDLGLVPTLTRKIAMARVREETRGRSQPAEWSRYTRDLHVTGTRLLHWFSVVIFLSASAVGLPILLSLDMRGLYVPHVVLAYLLICVGIAVRTGTASWECQIIGSGHVASGTLLGILVQTITAVALLVVASLGGRLIALAATTLISVVVGRLALRGMFRLLNIPSISEASGNVDLRVVSMLVKPAIRCWLTNIGSILLFQVDNFFIAKWMGPARVPDYRAAFQLLLNVQMIATTIGTSASVFVTRSWGRKAHESVRRLTVRNIECAGLVLASAYGAILACGQSLFDLWIGPGHFVGNDVLVAIILALSVQAFSWTYMTAARATEHEDFAGWSLAGAAANLGLTWWLIEPLGYFGVALSTALALLATIGWYGTASSLARLQIRPREAALTMFRFALRFAAYFLVAKAAAVIGGESWLSVALAFIAVALMGLADAWSLMLDQKERSFLISRVTFWLRDSAAKGRFDG